MNNDFIGIKTGDVNEDFNELISSIRSVENSLTINLELVPDVRGSYLSFRTSKDLTLSGLQFEIEIDGLQAHESAFTVLGADLEVVPGQVHQIDDFLRVSWTSPSTSSVEVGDELFRIYLSDVFDVNSISSSNQWMSAEAYDKNLQKIDLIFSYKSANIRDQEIEAGVSAYPNPFKGETDLVFMVHQDEEVNVQLYSQDGKMLYNELYTAQKGRNVFHINADILEGHENGVFIYRVSSNSGISTGRLIRIE